VVESVKSEPIPLSPDQTVQEAFAAIMGSCLRQYRLNEDILLARPGSEAIHQARVALRRMRSALSIFKDLTEDGQRDSLRDELKWLAGELGKARDLDVLLQATQENDLRAQLIAERAAQYEALDQTLSDTRPRALMLDFAQWLATGDWRETADNEAVRQASVAGFAETALSKIFKRFRKQSAKLEKLSDEQRHEARKLAKKLRYGAEFFGDLYMSGKAGKRHERFLDRLEKVQDGLGKLNDLANVPELLDRHGLASARTKIDENDRSALIERAASACDALIETKPFWT
jgi:CHAD domain-containing protein